MATRKLNRDESELIDSLREGNIPDVLGSISDIVSQQEEEGDSSETEDEE